MPHSPPGPCEVCGRPRATTEIAEHLDDGLCWALRFYGGHDPGEILNALRAERSTTRALAAEVEVLKAQIASAKDPIRTATPKSCPARESGGYSCELEEGHEGGHACPKAVARFDELRRGVLAPEEKA